MTTNSELIDRFAHHPPSSDDVVAAHESIRISGMMLAVELNEMLPDSREKSLALTALGELVMYANQAIALGQVEYTVEVEDAIDQAQEAIPLPDGWSMESSITKDRDGE